jgi:hypothetical protein
VLEAPPPEQAKLLRQAALTALIQSFLTEAARFGFEADEVAQEVDELITRWQEEGAPPADRE